MQRNKGRCVNITMGKQKQAEFKKRDLITDEILKHWVGF